MGLFSSLKATLTSSFTHQGPHQTSTHDSTYHQANGSAHDQSQHHHQRRASVVSSTGNSDDGHYHDPEAVAQYNLSQSRGSLNTTRLVKVSVGPSPDNLTPLVVNDDAHPVFIDGPLFQCRIAVRIKKFNGWVPEGGSLIHNTKYFDTGRKRLFSIQMQARFKEDFSADDVQFGSKFERKVSPPPGVWIPLKIATVIDPSFSHDIYGEQPWFLSPLVSSMNTMSVHPLVESAPTKEEKLDEWTWFNGVELKEDTQLLWERGPNATIRKTPKPYRNTTNDRRRFFHKKAHRDETMFHKDLVYNLEMYSPYIDFNTFEFSLGGFSIAMEKYMNAQPFIFQIRSLEKDEILFCIKFDLVEVECD